MCEYEIREKIMKVFEIVEKQSWTDDDRNNKRKWSDYKPSKRFTTPVPTGQYGPAMNPNDVEREKRRASNMPSGATAKKQKNKKQTYMKPIISPDDLKGLKSFEGKKQAVGETATSGATSAGGIATNPGNGFANGGPGTLTRMGTTDSKKKKKKKVEGKSPHKKGTKKYKAHMAAMHAG